MRNKKLLLLLVLIMIGALLSSGCFFNSRPVIEAISDQIGKIGQEFIYQVIVYGSDNGELIYSLTEKPEGMQIESSTGLISWTPQKNQIGTFQVEVKVTWGNSFDIEQFEITIEDVFLTSIEVSPASISVYEGNSSTINSVTAYYDNGYSEEVALIDCDYSSDNNNVAVVNNGVVTGKSEGIATIMISYTEGGITKTDTISVTVKRHGCG